MPVGSKLRQSDILTPDQVASMGTPLPDFKALESVPSYLGYGAHGQLEDIIGQPVASSDPQSAVSIGRTGQLAGLPLSTLVGQEREFVRNLPKIEGNFADIAAERRITVPQLWDDMTRVLQGSGIGQPMHRTLDRPVGGSYGARTFIDERAESGIALLVRENIANWGARRQHRLHELLGGMSRTALGHVELIIYAGSNRQYKGPTELWRPELQPYVRDGATDLTEYRAGKRVHAPATRELIGRLGVKEQVDVATVYRGKGTGDQVVESVASKLGDRLRNLLIIEVGNAPAGYTQLAGALVLSHELGIDPTNQWLGVSDGVQIVHPDHFNALSVPEKSRVQNAQTALNSLNGWLKAIADVNRYMLDRQTQN